jgi:hypothetical protein
MSLYARLAQGTTWASESFATLLNNKKLLTYTAIPLGITMLAQLFAYNFLPSSAMYKLETVFDIDVLIVRLLTHFSVVNYIIAFGINVFNIFLVTFFYAALTHHVMRLLQGQSVSIRQCLRACMQRWQLILAWSLISAIVTMLLQLPAVAGASLSFIVRGTLVTTYSLSILIPIAFIVACISIVWSILTFLVVPLIAVEQITLRTAISLSFRIVQQALAEIAGGIFWIGIVTLVVFGLFALIGGIGTLLMPASINRLLFLILTITIPGIFFSFIIAAVNGIFKTKILYLFHERSVDELKQLQHPPF